MKTYYRPNLPNDLLQLIGEFSGFRSYTLHFTITPKRGFLGHILLCSPKSPTRILRQKHWKPLQIAGKNDLLKIKQYITLKTMFTWGIPIPGVVRDCMQAIHGILTEVHDFALCY